MNEISTADFGIVVYSDIACPWAHVAVHRLATAIEQRGLGDEIMIDHRAFPLELVNEQPIRKDLLDIEVPVCASLEPAAGWSLEPEPWTYPVSTLPALEAVQAAKAQGAAVSAALDLVLRRAMFESWRCLAVLPVVFEIAATVEGLDVDDLRAAIRSGEHRTEVWDQLDAADDAEIPGSPTFVLPDGTRVHNPGVEFDWNDSHTEITVRTDDPDAIGELVDAAVALRPAD